MNNQTKTVIVTIIACIAFAGVIWMISSTLPKEVIEPHGPMIGEDDVGPLGLEAIPWDEVIYVPIYPECKGEKMVFIEDMVKIEYANGTTIWHWLYTCEKAANRTPVILR